MERKNPGLGGVLRPLGRLGRSKSAFGPQGGVVCIPVWSVLVTTMVPPNDV